MWILPCTICSVCVWYEKTRCVERERDLEMQNSQVNSGIWYDTLLIVGQTLTVGTNRCLPGSTHCHLRGIFYPCFHCWFMFSIHLLPSRYVRFDNIGLLLGYDEDCWLDIWRLSLYSSMVVVVVCLFVYICRLLVHSFGKIIYISKTNDLFSQINGRSTKCCVVHNT